MRIYTLPVAAPLSVPRAHLSDTLKLGLQTPIIRLRLPIPP